MQLRRKISLAIVALTAAFVGTVVSAAPASAATYDGPWTATVTSDVCPHDDPYSSSDIPINTCKDKGDKVSLKCKVTNKYGNVWYKTPVSALLGRSIYYYSSHFSSAYKNILPKC